MSQTYTVKLASPEPIQVTMCTKNAFMPFFEDIYEHAEHMIPIEDVPPADSDVVKMITAKQNNSVRSVFKIWGDELDVAVFVADLEDRCREKYTIEVKNMD